ncbi:uncharacterized protein CTRU02_200484 [Colletotrichum truncatum]|uniref:Uncharacterized protein n=1 Tax=Colletotrichum truncatum TaxID=5467 RepID=A0ACC3ZEM9_COLTU|nr:uncharacterized protein CTRU02_00245 [Colletotrichum truncatum]KAF6801496.1 hypothetical protein CTRU02_00245 [Colletotrichum truncatum]
MRLPAKTMPLAPAKHACPSDPQDESPFFRLPLELRIDIYKIAFPRINSPQLVYTAVDNKLAFHEIGEVPSSDHHLSRIVCNGVFEDDGIEIQAKRRASHADNKRVQAQYLRRSEELLYPLPLLLACRRMYEDVAPHCDQSLAFQDFLTLECFFATLSGDSSIDGLLDRLNKVSLDVKFSNANAFKPSSRKKILASWTTACKKLSALKSIQCFHLRLEVPLSQRNSVPGNVHASIIEGLNPIAACIPEVKVELMLTSVVHPRSERVLIYQPQPSKNKKLDPNFGVSGWDTKVSSLNSVERLDEA